MNTETKPSNYIEREMFEQNKTNRQWIEKNYDALVQSIKFWEKQPQTESVWKTCEMCKQEFRDNTEDGNQKYCWICQKEIVEGVSKELRAIYLENRERQLRKNPEYTVLNDEIDSTERKLKELKRKRTKIIMQYRKEHKKSN